MTVSRSIPIFFGILLLLLSSGGAAGHGGCSSGGSRCNGVTGQLWLEIVGGEYIGDHSDPWLNESWVTSSPDFELNISYHRNSGSEDVEEIHLIVAVDRNPEGNVTIKINDSELEEWERVDSNEVEVCDYEYPPHGIYNGEDVWYAVYEIEFDSDNFSPGEHVIVDVKIDTVNPVKVHFDAVGCGDSHSCNCEAVIFVPPSHDATYYHSYYPIPEFPSIAIPIILLFGVIMILLRNR